MSDKRSLKPRPRINRLFLALAAIAICVFIGACTPKTGGLATIPLEADDQPGMNSTVTPDTFSPTVILTPGTQTGEPTRKPTLTPDDAELIIRALLEDNGGCKLPCIYGITPGIDIQHIREFLMQFGDVDIPKELYIYSRVTDDSGILNAIFWEDKFEVNTIFSSVSLDSGVADVLTFNSYKYKEIGEGSDPAERYVFTIQDAIADVSFYSIPQVISNNGAPSNILVAAFPAEPGAPIFQLEVLSIVLVYAPQGFFIEYIMPLDTVGPDFMGCPQGAFVSVLAWIQKEGFTIEDVLPYKGSWYGINQNNLGYYRSISAASNISNEEFTNRFNSIDSEECITTPIELWEFYR